MTRADDTILEFFEDTGIEAPPSVVQHNTGLSKSHAHRRMQELASEGLLTKVDDSKGYYGITEKGLAYLAGELEEEDLERD